MATNRRSVILRDFSDVRSLAPLDLLAVREQLSIASRTAKRGTPRARAIYRMLDYCETRLQNLAPRSGMPSLWPNMKGAANG